MKNIFLTLAMSLTLVAYGQSNEPEPKVVFEQINKTKVFMTGQSYRVRKIMRTASYFDLETYEQGTMVSLLWSKRDRRGRLNVLIKTFNLGNGNELYYYYIFE
jgi:hypothetical protein